jgi:hypothetical protein
MEPWQNSSGWWVCNQNQPFAGINYNKRQGCTRLNGLRQWRRDSGQKTHVHNLIIRSWCYNSCKHSIRNSSRFIFSYMEMSETTFAFRRNYLPSSLPSGFPYFVYRVIEHHTFALKDNWIFIRNHIRLSSYFSSVKYYSANLSYR